MAIPVARVQLAMAHAALPALLPTPPKSKMLPLLATSCVLILPMSPPKAMSSSPPKSSGADADERWDVSKSATKLPLKPGRADAVERWDAHKISPASPSSPCSSQSSSCSSKSNSSPASRASSSIARWDSNKRGISRASSAERWDAHKKPRPPLAEELHDEESSTASNDMELDVLLPQAMYAAGPVFIVSPDPSMLPMPSFMVRPAAA